MSGHEHRRLILQTQAAHAAAAAAGAAEARVYGQEPSDIAGVIHTKDGTGDVLTSRLRFVENDGETRLRVEYETEVTVNVYRKVLGPA